MSEMRIVSQLEATKDMPGRLLPISLWVSAACSIIIAIYGFFYTSIEGELWFLTDILLSAPLALILIGLSVFHLISVVRKPRARIAHVASLTILLSSVFFVMFAPLHIWYVRCEFATFGDDAMRVVEESDKGNLKLVDGYATAGTHLYYLAEKDKPLTKSGTVWKTQRRISSGIISCAEGFLITTRDIFSCGASQSLDIGEVAAKRCF
jgi:hypothetical protein